MKRFWADSRGTTAVEFALVCSVFTLVLVNSLGVGLLWWTSNAMQQAAILAARCASIGSCSASPASAAETQAAVLGVSFLKSSDVATSTVSSCSPGAGSGSGFTTVTIGSSAWVGMFLGPLSDVVLSGSACFPNPTP